MEDSRTEETDFFILLLIIWLRNFKKSEVPITPLCKENRSTCSTMLFVNKKKVTGLSLSLSLPLLRELAI